MDGYMVWEQIKSSANAVFGRLLVRIHLRFYSTIDALHSCSTSQRTSTYHLRSHVACCGT
jgi:hypothetical protein